MVVNFYWNKKTKFATIFIPSYHGPFKNHIIEPWKIHNKIIHIQLITLYIIKKPPKVP
jgi:hypothetical protein